ncbi:MAG: hypothetical protein H7Y41_06790 [Hyphomonadaceae bacterium]|nr:hypothetical protein [Clostridia bacterium]
MNRMNIFTGHFGSGKTEVAINFALQMKKQYDQVVIVDLDIVNPYFRTKDAVESLENAGVKVIASQYANTNIDIPAVPSEILSVFHEQSYGVVIDVGGDENGAMALGRYLQFFKKEPYELFFVYNAKRPFTDGVDNTIELLRNIETTSRLKVTQLINNTHLAQYSTVELLLEAQAILEKISEQTKLPIAFLAGKNEIISQLPIAIKHKTFSLDLQLHFPWKDNE